MGKRSMVRNGYGLRRVDRPRGIASRRTGLYDCDPRKGRAVSDTSASADRDGTEVGYTLSMFGEEVRIILAPVGIESRLQETVDGSRSITAWPTDDPTNRAEFAIDQVRIGPYQAHIIATIIQRSFHPVTQD
jgi:hypothetical protein